jgi:hypothetical protein
MSGHGKGLRPSALRAIRRDDEDSSTATSDPRSREMGSLLKVQDPEVISALEAVFAGTNVMAEKEKAHLLLQVRDEIHSHWRSAKHSFLSIGKALLTLERTLSHEEFKRLSRGTERVFPFTETIAIQLRQVAKAVLAGSINENEMPGSYSVAYQIAVMDGATIEIARARNILRPDVTRTEIIAFRRQISAANTSHEEGVNLSAIRRKKARLTKLRDELLDRLAAVNAELERLDKINT